MGKKLGWCLERSVCVGVTKTLTHSTVTRPATVGGSGVAPSDLPSARTHWRGGISRHTTLTGHCSACMPLSHFHSPTLSLALSHRVCFWYHMDRHRIVMGKDMLSLG